MDEKTGTFEEFAEYLYSSDDNEKISIRLQCEDQTEKTDLFEFFLNLVIYGYKENFSLEKIKIYFKKMNVKLDYFTSKAKVYSPYEITSDLQLKKMFDSKLLYAEYVLDDTYIYISFVY